MNEKINISTHKSDIAEQRDNICFILCTLTSLVYSTVEIAC